MIIQNITVPTGNILLIQGDRDKSLECLSIGDYGKQKNIKADFLGLSDEINGVPHGDLMPLEKKWVITISSQYGCSMNCNFCDVPMVGPGHNATLNDLLKQVLCGMSLHPEVKTSQRLNIHFARMGEPTWNPHVITAAISLKYMLCKHYHVHPVVSTMMPKKNKNLFSFLYSWMNVKNNTYNGEAGLQLSINSTDPFQRREMFGDHAHSLYEISSMMRLFHPPKGRKIALNFALHHEYIVNADMLADLFSPDYFMCKITPIHLTSACKDNNIKTPEGYDNYYPYQKTEEMLKKSGFDVIVFVPSLEEDQSMITCGNAILAHK
jgi:23S rRNA (adenine2503-C2)-methyltransferase